jgi:cyanophycinase
VTTGYVIPIGGAEEKFRDPAILRQFVALCGGPAARIAVVPTASRLVSTGPRYRRIFQALGCGRATVVPLYRREDCGEERWLAPLRDADGVFLTGGNQLRISTTLGGTEAAEVIVGRWRADGLHVAGTSAGAAILSRHMIAYGDDGATPRADMVTLAPGLGLAEQVIIDQHFRQRDRLGRLLAALAFNPGQVGLGLDEDTAAFIDPQQMLTVSGSGAITVVDLSDVDYTGMDSANRFDPVSILGARLHVLTAGARFDLRARRPYPPPPPVLAARRAGPTPAAGI